MFFDTFEKLCAEKGISLSRALLDLDMGKSSITRWKAGGEPSNSTKRKIADYFNITVQQLMSGEIEKNPAEAEVNKEDSELWELREEMRSNPDMRMLFSLGKNMTTDELRKAVKIIQTMCGDDVDG